MEGSDNYSVYMHRNTVNGKVYIGITRQRPEARWGRNGAKYTHGHLKYAIKKYGWDNFDHIILYEHFTKDEACDMEKKLIAQYNANNREYGYNQSIGGEVNQGFKSEAISRSKMKPVLQYDLDGKYIAEYPSIMDAGEALGRCCNHISSVCNFSRRQSQNYIWRYKNDEFRPNVDLDISVPRRGKKQESDKPSMPRTKQVDQYSMKGDFITTFHSITAAEKSCGYTGKCSKISECCRGKRPSAHGYVWAFSGEEVRIPQYKNKKAVIQYDLDMNEVCVFDTVNKAADSVGANVGYLIDHLKGRISGPYKGYIWEYA